MGKHVFIEHLLYVMYCVSGVRVEDRVEVGFITVPSR